MKDVIVNAAEYQCHGKQGFSDHDLAVKVARKGSRSKETSVSAYKCPHCHQFHVGNTVIKKPQINMRRGIKVVRKHS